VCLSRNVTKLLSERFLRKCGAGKKSKEQDRAHAT
jgi:hypothetical protein